MTADEIAGWTELRTVREILALVADVAHERHEHAAELAEIAAEHDLALRVLGRQVLAQQEVIAALTGFVASALPGRTDVDALLGDVERRLDAAVRDGNDAEWRLPHA